MNSVGAVRSIYITPVCVVRVYHLFFLSLFHYLDFHQIFVYKIIIHFDLIGDFC